MEIIKSLAIDYLLFSLWDSLVFYLFINKLTKIKLKFIDVLVVGAVFCLSSLVPPIARQIIGIMVIYSYIISFRNKIDKENMKIKDFVYPIIFIIFEYLYSLTIEVAFSLSYELFKIADISKLEGLSLFKYYIPSKILEIILIFIIRRLKMKQWFGSGVVRK